MQAWVISAISQKGGTCKSTLIRALAKAASDNAFKVKVADLDFQQGTTTKWHMRRLGSDLPGVGSVECFRTVDDAFAAVEAAPPDILLIDGPARASEATLKIAMASHVALQPTGPCIDEMDPAIGVFRALQAKGVDKKKLLFVITGVRTEAEFRDAFAYLSETGFPVLEEHLDQMPAYRNSHNVGKTILETPFASLNAKADGLVQAVFDYLGKTYG